MLIDLHVQSRLSKEGTLEPEEILLRAKSSGLDGVVFTEDQPHTDWKELKEVAEQDEMLALFALKVITLKGYYLLYVPDPALVEPGALFPKWHHQDDPFSIKEVQAAAQRVGGVLVAAHPYNLRLPHPSGDRIFQVRGINAIEVQNGACNKLANDFALEAASLLRIPGVGGSAALTTLSPIGKAATLFLDTITDEASLVASMKPGHMWPIQMMDELPKPSHNGHRERRDDRRGGRDRDDRRGGDRRGGDRRGGDRRGGDRRGGDRRGGRGGDRRGGRR